MCPRVKVLIERVYTQIIFCLKTKSRKTSQSKVHMENKVNIQKNQIYWFFLLLRFPLSHHYIVFPVACLYTLAYIKEMLKKVKYPICHSISKPNGIWITSHWNEHCDFTYKIFQYRSIWIQSIFVFATSWEENCCKVPIQRCPHLQKRLKRALVIVKGSPNQERI